MLIRRTFLSLLKRPIFLRGFQVSTKPNFNNKESSEELKKEENEKKHKEINKKFQEYKQTHQFDLEKPSQAGSKFITETRKKKEAQELKALFETFQTSIQDNFNNLDEKAFLTLLSKINHAYDNSVIMQDPKFHEFIRKMANRINVLKDLRQSCFFICFCSVSGLLDAEIWDCFTSFILNNKDKMQVETKCMLLFNYVPANEKNFGNFFNIFGKEFEEKIKAEKYTLRTVYEIHYIFRKYDKGSEALFSAIENFIEKSIDEISLENLISYIGYYSTSSKEKRETIIKFLDLFEKKLLQMTPFLNSFEILQVLYSYIKSNAGSEELLRKLENRVLAIIDSFNVQEIERLVVLISNSPRKSEMFDAIERQILKTLKTLKPYNFPGIFFTFAMNNIGTAEFYNILTDKIISSLFVFTPEQVSRLIWSYAVKQPGKDLFFKKAQEYIIENSEKFSMNEIANIVWSYTEVRKGSNLMFLKLEEQITKKAQNLTVKEVAKIFWGYVNKMALNKKIVDAFVGVIKQNLDDLDAWDLATILWAFSRFKTEEYNDLYDVLKEKTMNLCDEMNNYELVTSIRAYSEKNKISKDLLEVFLKKIKFALNGLTKQECVVLINCLINLKEVSADLENIVDNLDKKLKSVDNVRV